MEKLAKKIAQIAGQSSGYDDEKVAVIAYGLTSMFQMAIILAVCLAIGIVFGFWAEVLILFFAVGLLRSATGGAHSQTFGGCMVISIGMVLLLSAASYFLGSFLSAQLCKIFFPLLFALCYLTVFVKAPVDNPRKRITRPEKIKKLRQRAFCLLTVYMASCFLLAFFQFYTLALAFALGSFWQIFTLTPVCALMIGAADTLFLPAVSNKSK